MFQIELANEEIPKKKLVITLITHTFLFQSPKSRVVPMKAITPTTTRSGVLNIV